MTITLLSCVTIADIRRYRLMLRRILASRELCFGMIMHPSREGQAVNYGTMLEVSHIHILPDGRSIVQTIGTYRFRIAKRKEFDGYLIAKVDRYAAITPTSILLTFCPPGNHVNRSLLGSTTSQQQWKWNSRRMRH